MVVPAGGFLEHPSSKKPLMDNCNHVDASGEVIYSRFKVPLTGFAIPKYDMHMASLYQGRRVNLGQISFCGPESKKHS